MKCTPFGFVGIFLVNMSISRIIFFGVAFLAWAKVMPAQSKIATHSFPVDKKERIPSSTINKAVAIASSAGISEGDHLSKKFKGFGNFY